MSFYRLIEGDSRSILRSMKKGSVDCIITDPPYGLGFDYGSDYKDTKSNLKKLIKCSLPDMRRISKRVAVMCGPTQIWEYPKPTWTLAICWNTTGSFGHYGYSQWTPVLMYGEDIKGMGKINGVLKSDLHFINGGGSVGFQRSLLENEHVCPKPIGIIEYLIKRLTNKDETVLDPFGGSGTTMTACQKHNRNCITIEKNPQFCEIIRKRCFSIKSLDNSIRYENELPQVSLSYPLLAFLDDKAI